MKYIVFLSLISSFFLNVDLSYSNNSPQENCSECHSEMLDFRVMHPVMEMGCETCHESTGEDHPNEGRFKLTETLPGLCYMCHEKYTKKNLHYPTDEGECLSCHSPHGSEFSSILNVEASKICAECHETGVPENNFGHYPYAEGECSSCHDSHQSDNSSLLKSPIPALCYECHENTSEGATSVHAVLEECSTCHGAHSAEQPKLLIQEMPTLCFNCHEESSGEYEHTPVKNGECSGCHNPHASEQASLLTANKQELCLNCHSKTYRTDSTLVENIGQKIKNAKLFHAAIEIDGCSTCHSAHSTGKPAMLKSNFPGSYYTRAKAENFALCFDCHDAAILQEDASASGTNFRNGSQNLHYFHINGTRGRSCIMCHDVHASINEHLIRDVVPFGKWEMQMNYKPFENGGSCLPGCHGELKYDRALSE
ncbi:MAG: cytochrome c3 family protein [Bacteroidales bacterium]|nr:cytochrome c3 family protein [Bacteroidales bacterium]